MMKEFMDDEQRSRRRVQPGQPGQSVAPSDAMPAMFNPGGSGYGATTPNETAGPSDPMRQMLGGVGAMGGSLGSGSTAGRSPDPNQAAAIGAMSQMVRGGGGTDGTLPASSLAASLYSLLGGYTSKDSVPPLADQMGHVNQLLSFASQAGEEHPLTQHLVQEFGRNALREPPFSQTEIARARQPTYREPQGAAGFRQQLQLQALRDPRLLALLTL